MNSNANEANRTYCIDLAKNKFQMNVYASNGVKIRQRRFTRAKFDEFFRQRPAAGSLVVMEACASSHYWSRRLQCHGWPTKLVPPQFVAKQRIGNKTDDNDADGIYAVHRDPRVRPVPTKTLAQQDLAAHHRLRELLIRQRTQYVNQARGLLAERGCVAARGHAGFAELLTCIRQIPSEEITPVFAELIELSVTQIQGVGQQIAAIEARLQGALDSSPVAQNIDTIFGVGALTATAFDAEFSHDVSRFADARQFAGSLGIAPSEHSSGQTRRLGPITKRGNRYLRKLLVQCAQSVVMAAHRRDDALCLFAQRLIERGKPRNQVVVAVANRLARIIYAVIKHRCEYRPHAGLTRA